ncbi:hypothetical protein ACJ3XI_04600 [Litorimonas sp. RW-G-Af-16]|uniref:hypothetical protein n=1 Tax=Litorimonas sp. RW-G-Af-16 TaxID=3241168 RepID=UPI00390CC10C
MTRIKDMSEPERQSWITLLADGAVFIYFWQKMAYGWQFKPEHFEPAELGVVVFQIVVVTIILHAVIASIFAVRSRNEAAAKDERDVEIARRGSQNGYMFLQIGVGTILVTLLLQYMAGQAYSGPISVIKPVEMIFYLAAISYLADLFKQITKILAYRK